MHICESVAEKNSLSFVTSFLKYQGHSLMMPLCSYQTQEISTILDFSNCPNFFLPDLVSNQDSGTTFSCHVSLVSFSLKWSLSLSLSLRTLMFFKSTCLFVYKMSLTLGLPESFLGLISYRT